MQSSGSTPAAISKEPLGLKPQTTAPARTLGPSWGIQQSPCSDFPREMPLNPPPRVDTKRASPPRLHEVQGSKTPLTSPHATAPPPAARHLPPIRAPCPAHRGISPITARSTMLITAGPARRRAPPPATRRTSPHPAPPLLYLAVTARFIMLITVEPAHRLAPPPSQSARAMRKPRHVLRPLALRVRRVTPHRLQGNEGRGQWLVALEHACAHCRTDPRPSSGLS